MKITNEILQQLKKRVDPKYKIPKYIIFCEEMISSGFTVTLLRSRSTVSKYVFVKYNNISIKVRFSNHRPTKSKQDTNDSDFYVGISNYGCITTEELIPIVKNILQGKNTSWEEKRKKK